MRIHYDDEVDVLSMRKEGSSGVFESLYYDCGVAVELATEDGHDIAGLLIEGASAFLPLGERGYDAESDTLRLGRIVADADLVTENGDLIAYWQTSDIAPDEYYDAIGVAIRNASVHFANMVILTREPAIR